MRKILALCLAFLICLSGSAQAGLLNLEGFNKWKTFVDNCKESTNYEMGTYLERSSRTGNELYALRLYDWVGTEEVPKPEGETEKLLIPYVSLQAGYASPHLGVLGLSTHVDELIRHLVRKTPGVRNLGLNVPKAMKLGLGYGLSYDFDTTEGESFDTSAVGYGITCTGALAFKF